MPNPATNQEAQRSSTFIADFRALFMKTPQCGSWTRASENCDYGDITTVSKDCYMCFNSGNCQQAYYCEDSRALTDSTDCAFCESCQLCYECTDCDTCYNCNFCQDCTNCQDINFSYDLRRCKNCTGCVGLRDKEFYIFNQPYTASIYAEALKNLNLEDAKMLSHIDAKLEELKRQIPRMFTHQHDTTNCTGDYIYHSKNCHQCFDTRHTEDSGYITQANLDMGTKDSFDCGPIPTGMELCYDVSASHFLFNCKHLYWCGNLKDSEWSTNCMESEYLFGCHYLLNKQGKFYILNEEVSEEDYQKLTTEIKAILLKEGIYTIHDLLYKPISEPTATSPARPTNSATPLPPETQTHRTCEICTSPFELCQMEIDFYHKHTITFPVYCPSCRALKRLILRNERKMHKRKCDNCKSTLISTFPADSPHIVYCLNCWLENRG